MGSLSQSKRSRSRYVDLDGECAALKENLAQLRHRVLNDYQAVIACIFDEGAAASNPEVKVVLTRIADCVYDLACSLRNGKTGSCEPYPSFDFGPGDVEETPT